jgi:hypothetical protein
MKVAVERISTSVWRSSKMSRYVTVTVTVTLIVTVIVTATKTVTVPTAGDRGIWVAMLTYPQGARLSLNHRGLVTLAQDIFCMSVQIYAHLTWPRLDLSSVQRVGEIWQESRAQNKCNLCKRCTAFLSVMGRSSCLGQRADTCCRTQPTAPKNMLQELLAHGCACVRVVAIMRYCCGCSDQQQDEGLRTPANFVMVICLRGKQKRQP